MPAHERGEGEIAVLVILGILGLAVWGGVSLWRDWTADSTEQSGTVKYEDCREVLTVEVAEARKLRKRFTCESRRTFTGILMTGHCVYVETSGPVCTKAYVYDQHPAVNCQPTTPWLSYDDKCYQSFETGRVWAVATASR